MNEDLIERMKLYCDTLLASPWARGLLLEAIIELEARASIELTQSQNHDHVRKLARLHPIASEETADLARPLPDKP